MTTLYNYNADTNRMQIRSRDQSNELVATVEGIDIYACQQISLALDRMYRDGLHAGGVAVINSVTQALDQIVF